MAIQLRGILPLAILLVAANLFIFGAFNAWLGPFMGWLGGLSGAVTLFVFTYAMLWVWKKYLGGDA